MACFLVKHGDYFAFSIPWTENRPCARPVPTQNDKAQATNGTEFPLDAGNRSAGKLILRLVWNLDVHYRVHKGPPLDIILSYMNPGHTLNTQFLLRCIVIIITSTLRSFECFFPSVFPTEVYAFLICYMRAPYPNHIIHLDFITPTTQSNAEIYSFPRVMWHPFALHGLVSRSLELHSHI
jgi:hypothetical protein